ncbi:MAG TPA: hypothetical protein VNP92_25205, partial [Actinophytocola sp.]|nr:hypothetical protein [Actinophytocola sp.]
MADEPHRVQKRRRCREQEPEAAVHELPVQAQAHQRDRPGQQHRVGHGQQHRPRSPADVGADRQVHDHGQHGQVQHIHLEGPLAEPGERPRAGRPREPH